MIRAIQIDQVIELWFTEHHGVVVNFLHVIRGRAADVVVAFRAHVVSVIHACRVVAEETAAMRGDDFEFGVTFQHAAEHDVRQRHRGIQRIADHIGQKVFGQALRRGKADRVQEYHRAQLLGLAPHFFVLWVGDFRARNVGADFNAFEVELLHAVFKFLHRMLWRLHRQRAQGRETVRVRGGYFRDAFIDGARHFHAQLRLHAVVIL